MEFGFGLAPQRRASPDTSCVLSALARRATTSSCMSKRSAIGLSNRSDHRCALLSASISCTLTRILAPFRWTLPSRTIGRSVRVRSPSHRRTCLCRKGRIACDDEATGDLREVRGQAFSDAVDEILLFGIAADVGEGQHDNRKVRRPRVRFCGVKRRSRRSFVTARAERRTRRRFRPGFPGRELSLFPRSLVERG